MWELVTRLSVVTTKYLFKHSKHVKQSNQLFNRLADLLFTWARYAAKRDERSESVYTPKSESKKKETIEIKQDISNSKNKQAT